MNFTLGLFDLFAYAIPGSIYLAIFVYSAQTLDWIDLAQVSNISSIFIIVAIAIASFLLGHITYPLAGIIEQVFRLRELRALDAKSDFVAWRQLRRARRVPTVALMPFPEDVRGRGVLRTVGAVYQFRHATLQDKLAGHTTTSPPTSTAAHIGV